MSVESVFIFPNHMVVVFDERGRQIPMLQGRWEEVRERLIPAIRRCRPEVNDALGALKSRDPETYVSSIAEQAPPSPERRTVK